MSKRIQGKLVFYNLVGDGSKVQIMSSLNDFNGDDDAFRAAHNIIKRGDIIGVQGRLILICYSMIYCSHSTFCFID
jgi:lysyl-tRNA synthetase class II